MSSEPSLAIPPSMSEAGLLFELFKSHFEPKLNLQGIQVHETELAELLRLK